MNSHRRSYIFGVALLAIGFYQVYLKDFLEFALYGLAGIAFIVNALTYEPALERFKKSLVIASWIFILATGVMFLYVLQFKFV
jgi:hypothetical protein